MTTPSSPSRHAFSYVRFSTGRQAEGGSLRRQTSLSLAYCKRKNLALDDSLTLHDLGVSAFRSANVKDGALAAFLEACRLGRVPAGSVLIVESLDRLSRDQIRPALQLFMALQDHGITIVTLQPEREYPPDSTDALGLVEPLIVFARAHEESLIKSHRRRDGWKQARDRARTGGGPMMKTCPAWLEVTDDGFRVKPKAAAAVRRIFTLAREGMGLYRIAQELARDGVPGIGRSGRWTISYLHHILTVPAAMGSYQPNKQKGRGVVPDGEPIPNYYPPVITEAEWREAQAALQARGGDFDASGKFRRGGSGVRGAGRKGKGEPNLFTALVHDATTGHRMIMTNGLGRKNGGPRKRYVRLAATHATGAARGRTIDYGVFEAAILDRLKELKPEEVGGDAKPSDGRKAELVRLNNRLLDLDSRLERAKQRARAAEDFDAFLDLIQSLQDERKQVLAQRAELEKEESGGAAADLRQAHSLIDTLASTPPKKLEEVRRRLRQRIAQLLGDIRVVLVRRGKTALCAAQVYFRGGDLCRNYLIMHRPGNRYGEGYWWVRSLAEAALPGDLDLRQPEHARELEEALLAVPLDAEALAG